MSPVPNPLHALLLTAVDFGAATLLYRFVGPALGLLVGLAGVLLLCSLVYRVSRRARQPDEPTPS